MDIRGLENSSNIVAEAGKTVALKVVPAIDKETFWKIMLEISWLGKCTTPFITSFYMAHMKGNDLWICMEYCDVGSVARVLSHDRVGLAEGIVSSILYQVVRALEYLHGKLVLHRDVKAENILLTSKGFAKLGDLGVAYQLQATWDACKTVTGKRTKGIDRSNNSND